MDLDETISRQLYCHPSTVDSNAVLFLIAHYRRFFLLSHITGAFFLLSHIAPICVKFKV